jgi:hypothetical protein
MFNVPLSTITQNDLCGTWKIVNSFALDAYQENVFGKVYKYTFIEDGAYEGKNGIQYNCNWIFHARHDIVNNPVIEFRTEEAQVGLAIITKMIKESRDKILPLEVSLYFSNGLEVILERHP